MGCRVPYQLEGKTMTQLKWFGLIALAAAGCDESLVTASADDAAVAGNATRCHNTPGYGACHRNSATGNTAGVDRAELLPRIRV